MLLRSSSAPASQTLFPESPHRDFNANISNKNHRLSNTHENCSAKISFSHGGQHLRSFSCNSSPEFSPKGISIGRKTFRRARSDSNLDGLAFSTSFDLEEVYRSRILRTASVHNRQKQMLHTEPSFSIYNTDDKFEEEIEIKNEEKLERSATIGGSIEAEFSFAGNDMLMIKEDEEAEEEDEEESAKNRFKDLKIVIRDESNEVGGKGVEFKQSNSDLEEYYNELVREDPSNPLVLRNYAQFLESKRDFSGAEDYYFRATLADPKDGEIMSRYAKLVWDLHHDRARASTYFEMAARAAPGDSHVLAAYASFLWETDENEEEEDHIFNTQVDENVVVPVNSSATVIKEETRPSSPPLHLAMGLGINMPGFGNANNTADYMNTDLYEISSVEEYYRKMVEENPCNPLFLRNYAQFLHQSMGNLRGAEEYYSRAILLDPSDGQILSLYADIVWQLHRDKDRASAYFERAVQATPADSNVLGAYAKFLWETEDEDDVMEESYMQVAEGSTAANA
ncbi:hypothetical protein BUALT_Bualt14G0050200 [Buddleja alternifolia]|uniref:Uncharacterized protein n=1 Tax=Buddleja alternifolia TaxID=168488 RepID=A0AAV6WI76_9LAMI|nr:hypothetical protein BUALT_Bualt14G0050200 [Buddleja alternifolia]